MPHRAATFARQHIPCGGCTRSIRTTGAIEIDDVAQLASWEYVADRWWCTVCQWRQGRVPPVAERVARAATP